MHQKNLSKWLADYPGETSISLKKWQTYYEDRPLDLSIEVLLACNKNSIQIGSYSTYVKDLH